MTQNQWQHPPESHQDSAHTMPEKTAKRVVILHYHLFKNAGTSVDRILQENFPGKWVTAEFPRMPGPAGNTELVKQWIIDNPEAIAFSTHTAIGPIPEVPGVRIISVLFLRDPIERIKSAYRFERQQLADTMGARLARENDLEGYVRARLAIPNDRQCRNFQTERLASIVPGTADEFERASNALALVSFVGLVSKFALSLEKLENLVRAHFPTFVAQSVHANKSKNNENPTDRESAQLRQKLEEANKNDLKLVENAEIYAAKRN
jgi:hypothetical protein